MTASRWIAIRTIIRYAYTNETEVGEQGGRPHGMWQPMLFSMDILTALGGLVLSDRIRAIEVTNSRSSNDLAPEVYTP